MFATSCMEKILSLTEDVSSRCSTVLTRGESGTGNWWRGQSISPAIAEKPFIAVSCAALTETLLESELFG